MTHSLSQQHYCISQEYFDDVCRENQDVFDLDPDDAVTETKQQLLQSSSGALLDHLSTVHPDSPQGIAERIERQEFVQALECLADDNASMENVMSSLQLILQMRLNEEQSSSSSVVYSHVFVANEGWKHLFQAWRAYDDCEAIVEHVLSIASALLTCSNGGSKAQVLGRSLQEAMPDTMSTWLSSYARVMDKKDFDLLEQLLVVAYGSAKQCEGNKKKWMSCKLEEETYGKLTLATLLMLTLDIEELPETVVCAVAKLIIILCTFEDVASNSNTTAGPTVASAHDNVQVFCNHGAIFKLHTALKRSLMSPSMLQSQLILALRCLAICESSVQGMVAVGLLDTVYTIATSENDNDKANVWTATMGLVRNLCAQDELKCTLCTGKKSIVAWLIRAMNEFDTVALLNEHACGVMAAMSLRSPTNAAHLVAQGAAPVIVKAMRRHPTRVALQRQAALAIRNVTSRSPELRAAFLDAGAEATLREIAAQHVGCQDEVYAALRDLGLKASMLHVQHDDSGKVVLQPTQMFGERNPNFRPVF